MPKQCFRSSAKGGFLLRTTLRKSAPSSHVYVSGATELTGEQLGEEERIEAMDARVSPSLCVRFVPLRIPSV